MESSKIGDRLFHVRNKAGQGLNNKRTSVYPFTCTYFKEKIIFQFKIENYYFTVFNITL